MFLKTGFQLSGGTSCLFETSILTGHVKSACCLKFLVFL